MTIMSISRASTREALADEVDRCHAVIKRLEDQLHERNDKLVYVTGWLRGTADILPEGSAEQARRLARECRALVDGR
jgi:hypothetical protein